MSRYGIRRWIVGMEKHKSGCIHYHAGLETINKWDIKDLRKAFGFDIGKG